MSSTDLAIINLRREIEKQNYIMGEILDELRKLNEHLNEKGE